MSDLPPGWKVERVSPPDQHKLPPSDKYRENWERVFGKKEEYGGTRMTLKQATSILFLAALFVFGMHELTNAVKRESFMGACAKYGEYEKCELIFERNLDTCLKPNNREACEAVYRDCLRMSEQKKCEFLWGKSER